MSKATVIGIDLAKHVFQLSGLNNHQKQLLNRRFNRQGLMTFMAPGLFYAVVEIIKIHYGNGPGVYRSRKGLI